MKYISEFRDPELAHGVVAAIKKTANPEKHYRLMEFCGGHTHAAHKYAIQQLLPDNVELIHGPGCPVCILPIGKIDQAIHLALKPEIIFCSYADMLRVPGSNYNSLLKVKAQGADIRMVYSVNDALNIALKNPDKKVIFFAIGFETTTPPTAVAILKASKLKLNNFQVFCNHVLTPAAMQAILTSDDPINLDGFIGPSHVSIVIGSSAYNDLAVNNKKPIVIAGFEPLDLLQSILMLVNMINNQEYTVKNQYTRAVYTDGNTHAQILTNQVFKIRDSFKWRGLGEIPYSGVSIREEFSHLDCEIQYDKTALVTQEHKGCACPDVLRGRKKPEECKLYAKVCTPENPMGACMVSSEGACAAHYHYTWSR